MLDATDAIIDLSSVREENLLRARQRGALAWEPGEWRLVALVADFAPILILSFTRAGQQATWFIDAATGTHLGERVAALDAAAREALAVGLSRLLAAGFAAFLEGDDTESSRMLEGLLALDAATRVDLLALVTAPSLPCLLAVGLDQPDFRGIEIAAAGGLTLSAAQLAVPLGADVQSLYVAACQDGQLAFASPVDGAPCADVRGFCLGTLLMAYRVRDARHGLTFWVLVAGHHQTISGLILAEAGWLVCAGDQGRQNLVQVRVAPLQALFEHWRAHLPELRGWLARPIQRFATFTWPVGAAHLGHYIWNELPGLELAARALPNADLPLLYELVPDPADNFFGPVETIFPEFAGLVWRGCHGLEAMARHAYGAGVQILRFSGDHVSAALRARLEAAPAEGPGVAEVRETIAWLLMDQPLVVVFGLRVENRTLVDQAGFFCQLMRRLHAAHRDLVVVVDGHNVRGDGRAFESFFQHRSQSSPTMAEREILAVLVAEAQLLGVALVDCVGRPMAENLLWLRQADCFVAPWGAGLAKYSWVAGRPGFCLSSAHNRRFRHDLGIYSSPDFMEAPPEILFSEAEEVIDLPDAPQLIEVTMAGVAPFYANYDIAADTLLERISLFVDRIRRARPPRRAPVSLAGLAVVGDVLRGRQGHLFLAGGGHQVVEHAAGWRSPSPASIATFAANLRGRAAIAAELGCAWLHVVYPDKQTVLAEMFPLPQPASLGAAYLARLPELAPEVAGRVLFPIASWHQKWRGGCCSRSPRCKRWGRSPICARTPI